MVAGAEGAVGAHTGMWYRCRTGAVGAGRISNKKVKHGELQLMVDGRHSLRHDTVVNLKTIYECLLMKFDAYVKLIRDVPDEVIKKNFETTACDLFTEDF
ncbi:unnamed protein product [Rotaria sp. Silwood2]|nr:unnamed protein product [Rotaria sp. Silwood2]CAF4388464.1 unnamed protein product [Rotaria sp. Silwood2]